MYLGDLSVSSLRFYDYPALLKCSLAEEMAHRVKHLLLIKPEDLRLIPGTTHLLKLPLVLVCLCICFVTVSLQADFRQIRFLV